MELAFTRVGRRSVRVTAERDDGGVLETRSSGAAERLPHDLIHYVVERELGLDDGLWGRVARGATYGTFCVLRRPARRLQARRPTRARASSRGLLEAEVLVGVFHDIWDGTAEREWGSVRAFLDGVWSPRTRSRADELDGTTIRRVCNALTRMENAWRRIPLGGELGVTW